MRDFLEGCQKTCLPGSLLMGINIHPIDKHSSLLCCFTFHGISMEEIPNQLDVETAVGRLPDELSEVVILYYFQGIKLKEIAQILQIGLPLVKYNIFCVFPVLNMISAIL